MKKLEDKIINKIYSYEAKVILIKTILKIITLFIVWLLIFIFSSAIIEDLLAHNSFDFLQLISEDFEIFRNFIVDAIYVFYLEIPKLLLSILFIVIIILLVLTIHTIINFCKIKNKIKAIFKYWHRTR